LGETPKPFVKQEATSQPGRGKEKKKNGRKVSSDNLQTMVVLAVGRLHEQLSTVALLRDGAF